MIIDLLDHQLEFIKSTARHTAIVGGFRSGKTHAGCVKTLAKKMLYPGYDVAYYLPTYSLIKDIAFPKFRELLTNQRIPFTLNISDKNITTPFGRIIMRSVDNPDLIIGYEVCYSLVDEADVLTKAKMTEVMIKIIARNSIKIEGCNNATDFVSTPEGYRFMHDFFVRKLTENKRLIKARTENNPFISDSYIESLKETYTPERLEAYLNGEFVNFTAGTVYHHFDRDRNNSEEIVLLGDTLHIGLDFNITKMSAVIHVFKLGILTAVDEIVNAYDTNEICQLIKKKYPGKRIIVYPDASGDSRKTSSESTDFQIIRNAGFSIVANKSNPSVESRISTTNMALRDNNDKIKYFVNVNNCPNYTDALEQLAYNNNAPDKSSGLDHIADAGTYCVYQLFNRNISKSISVKI